MPRKKTVLEPSTHMFDFNAIFDQTGAVPLHTVEDWEPRTQEVWDCIMRIISHGAQVVVRQGMGGQSLGISIWQGKNYPPPHWIRDEVELHTWCAKVMERTPQRRQVTEDEGV